jgi:membrane-associated protease RseP (regulator of RpoE activity)
MDARRQRARREWGVAALLLLATFASTWLAYGFFWSDGAPWASARAAGEAAQYAVGIVAILVAHEAGHYVVGRRHAVEQSPPWFLPVPLAFGTMGAIIRMRRAPGSRTALAEMAAGGPLAGFVVAVAVLGIGLGQTVAVPAPEWVTEWPPPPPPPAPDWLVAVDAALGAAFGAVERAAAQPGWGWLGALVPALPAEPTQTLLILANPPLMDWLGVLLLGAAPGRYDTLGPLALAGWAGCFLTAMNLLPIGQLDGGHIVNALWPAQARRVSVAAAALVLVLGALYWPGWAVWVFVMWAVGAWRSVPLPAEPPPGRRAWGAALACAAAFGACFMPSPIEQESRALREMVIRRPDGSAVTPGEVEAWLQAAQGQP